MKEKSIQIISIRIIETQKSWVHNVHVVQQTASVAGKNRI